MDSEKSLQGNIGNKIKNRTLNETDFDAVFQLFKKICNAEDVLAFELKGYNESFQFIFENYICGMVFENGKCEIYKGLIKCPELTFRIQKKIVVEILTGQVYSAVAHMNGDIDYIGYKNGAIRFAEILETVLDEISNNL